MSRSRRSRLTSGSLRLERMAKGNRLRRVLILSAPLRLCVNQIPQATAFSFALPCLAMKLSTVGAIRSRHLLPLKMP